MEDAPAQFATVPMKWIGPLRMIHQGVDEEIQVPLATYESPLWPSTARGARVSVLAGGIRVTVVDDRMTRSVVFEAADAGAALAVATTLRVRQPELAEVVRQTSRFATLLDIHTQHVANLLYLRFEFQTGDASGHNMATKASERLMQWIEANVPGLRYVSLSANYCTDKKVSAVNGILGRGKNVIAELTVPGRIVSRHLKSTPAKIAGLNIKKNLLGTMLAGGMRAANAHYANILLGFYLATGQDAANIVEGSQGFTHAEARGDDLYFSATLPNVIVGTVGNGKGLPFVQENLERLGCRAERPPGENARRLAALCGAATLCGELSLMAALTNPGELMAAHLRLERA